MFKKITTMHAVEPVDAGDKIYVSYGIEDKGKFKGVQYTDFKASHSLIKAFNDLIPKDMLNKFNMSLMSINRSVIPHTDSNTKTAINLYLETGGYTTGFCKPKDGVEPFKLPSQTDGIVYQFEDVDIVDTFVAQPGDVYVLDVTKVHCVYAENEPDCERTRVALNFATLLPFDEVVEILAKK